MECRHCKYYTLLENWYHGQCIIDQVYKIHPEN